MAGCDAPSSGLVDLAMCGRVRSSQARDAGAYSGLGGLFLYIPIDDTQVYVYAACRQTEAASLPNGHAVAARFEGSGAPRAMFDCAGCAARPFLPRRAAWRGSARAIERRWTRRAVLVGDALHACSPNMAQGVSVAARGRRRPGRDHPCQPTWQHSGVVLAPLIAPHPSCAAVHEKAGSLDQQAGRKRSVPAGVEYGYTAARRQSLPARGVRLPPGELRLNMQS